MKSVALLIFLVLLSSCTTTSQAISGLNSNLRGKNVDSFFLKFGPPSQSYKLSNGSVIYTWAERARSYTIPGSSSGTANAVGSSVYIHQTHQPASTVTVQCVLRIITKNNIIEEVQAHSDSVGNWQTSRCNEVFGKIYPSE